MSTNNSAHPPDIVTLKSQCCITRITSCRIDRHKAIITFLDRAPHLIKGAKLLIQKFSLFYHVKELRLNRENDESLKISDAVSR